MIEVAQAGGLALVGWLAGLPLAYVAYRLEAGAKLQASAEVLNLVAPDPALQGFQALSLPVLPLRFGLSMQLAVFGALSLVLTLVLFVDLRTRFVYGIVAYPGIVAGVVLTPLAQRAAFWEALASAFVGFVVFGALYLIGRL